MDEEKFYEKFRRYPYNINTFDEVYETKKIQILDSLYLKYLNRHIDNNDIENYNNFNLNDTLLIEDEIKNSIETKLHNDDNWLNKYLEKFKYMSFDITDRVTNKSAVIVETRKNPLLEPIIKNMLHFLDDTWNITIFHGNENEEYVKNINIKGLKYLNLKLNEKITTSKYNEIMCSTEFWNSIDHNTVLLFQTDSVIVKNGIEKFLKYDYIGAPWGNKKVGNGGFSIRKKDLTLAILDLYKRPYWENEDVFYSRILYKHNNNLPSYDVAKMFCVESEFYEDPIAYHQAWKFNKINKLYV